MSSSGGTSGTSVTMNVGGTAVVKDEVDMLRAFMEPDVAGSASAADMPMVPLRVSTQTGRGLSPWRQAPVFPST